MKRTQVVRGATAVMLCMTMALAGCSMAWIGQAEQIVAVLIPAAANIVALVAAMEGKSVSAADLQTIQNAGTQAGADLQLIQGLIAAYQKADDTGKVGILNQIQSALVAVQVNLQGVLPSLHIKDAATQAKIAAVVGILLAEVQSLAAILPLVKVGVAAPTLSQSARKDGTPRAGKAPLSASEFVASYNATMAAKTGNGDVDRVTAALKIHEHGKAARVATVGWLK